MLKVFIVLSKINDMKKILFIAGSMNQTTQMHKIYMHLKNDYDCYFTPFYTYNPIGMFMKWAGLFDNTILAGRIFNNALSYLKYHELQLDYKAKKYKNEYELVFMCTDMLVPNHLKNVKKVWVQEGMIDKLNTWGKIVKFLGLPGYFAGNTALNGSTNICDVYCAASEGFANYISKMGTDRNKIIVTGTPNMDNFSVALNNNFPHFKYVLVCTSDIRELGGSENRIDFIKKCVLKAKGRKMIFKLHPNEKFERANLEIILNTPSGTLVFQEGNTNEMIANCDELITQWSTVVFVGLALGKKVDSYFDINFLKELSMVQNGGKSAERIAQIGRELLEPKKSSIYKRIFNQKYEAA